MKKTLLSVTLLLSISFCSIAQVYQQWTQTFGSNAFTESERAGKSATDIFGNIYTVGAFYSATIIGNDTLKSAGGYDIFISKYSSNGNFQWSRRAGGTSDDEALAIAVSGNFIYITGYFNGTANFNTPSASGSNELVSAGGKDIFVAKYTLTGNLTWIRRAGGSGSFEIGNGIDVVGNDVYITGEFSGTANFNTPSSGSSNTIVGEGTNQDIFITKFDNAGTFQWAKRAGGSSLDRGYDVAADANSVYIVGVFSTTANFNTPSSSSSNTISSAGDYDIFIGKFDNLGNFQWAKRAGGTNYDYGYGISINGTSVYITGYFDNSMNFNTPSASGSNELVAMVGSYYTDVFLAKYDNSGTLQWIKRMGGDSIDKGNDVFSNDSGVYVVGSFNNTANFNTPSEIGSNRILSAGGSDSFIAKFNINGDFQWAKRSGGIRNDEASGIANFGTSIYVLSTVSDTINFNTPSASGINEFDSREYDQNGKNLALAKYFENYVSVDWEKSAGSAIVGADEGHAVIAFGGNVYFTGSFVGTISLGSFNLTSAGNTDIFIAKANSDGVIQWAKRAGGTFNDVGYGIDTDGSSIYITGSFRNTANFNTPSASGSNELISDGLEDIFVAKYNDSGTLQWIKRAGGTGSDIGFGIKYSTSSLYVTGSFESTVNFNTPSANGSNELISAGGSDAFLAMLSSSTGSISWLKRAGGTGADMGNAVTFLNNNVYFTGSFEATANFNTPSNGASNTLVSDGDLDIFVAKFTSAGSFFWVRRAGGTGTDIGNGIAGYATNVYISGQFSATANFNTPSATGSNELISAGNRDAFVSKLDENGNIIWLRRAGGTLNDVANGIDANEAGVFIAGGFRNTANFNTPTATGSNEIITAGNRDIFIAHYDHLGSFKWAKRGGGTTDDMAWGVTADNSKIYTTGYFTGTANFNTPSASGSHEITSNGDEDIFITKITAEPLYFLGVQIDGASSGGYCQGNKIAIDGNGNIYSIAKYEGLINVNNTFYIPKDTLRESILIKYDKNGKILWVRRMGGEAESIVCDNNAVYITGDFSGIINFNNPAVSGSNELTAAGSIDMFVAKFNASGVFQWAKRAGTETGYCTGNDIALNGTSLYVVGSFSGTANFNTPSASGSNELVSYDANRDIFIAKYNTSGVLQWIRRAGSFERDEANGVAVTGVGDVYLTGNFSNVANFNTPSATGSNEIASDGQTDIFIAKFNSSGTFQWAKRAGGVDYDYGYKIQTYGTDAYLTGSFKSTANFNTPSSSGTNELVSAGLEDGFVAKYNSSGTVQWMKRFGGTGSDFGNDLVINVSNIYLAGRFESTINFNTPSNNSSNTLVSAGFRDILLANFNTSGVYQWAKKAGSSGSTVEIGNGVAAIGNSIYLTGYYGDNADFSFGGAVSNNLNALNADYFISALDICSTTVVLQNPSDNISGENTNKLASATNGTITATNQLTNNSTVSYKAKSITLNAGFKVDNGTVFNAQVGGCSQ